MDKMKYSQVIISFYLEYIKLIKMNYIADCFFLASGVWFHKDRDTQPLERQSLLQQTTFINIFSLFFFQRNGKIFEVNPLLEDSLEKSTLIKVKK